MLEVRGIGSFLSLFEIPDRKVEPVLDSNPPRKGEDEYDQNSSRGLNGIYDESGKVRMNQRLIDALAVLKVRGIDVYG
jgi:hypothetical protein